MYRERSRCPVSPRRGGVWPFLLVSAALSGGCAGSDPVTGYLTDAQALARGEAVFVGTCSGYCHVEGAAAGDVPDLFDCEWTNGGSNRQIFATVANGVPGTRMVGWGGSLPAGDEDIWKVVAFLRSRSPSC